MGHLQEEFTKVQELVYELKIEEAMTADVITVKPHNHMNELRDLLRDHRIAGVPVVEKNKLLGMVSIEDFIKSLADGDVNSRIDAKMTRSVTFLYADEPLVHAIQKFDKHGFGRLPVVNRKTGNMVGIITKGDIIKGLLKQLEVNYHEDEVRRYRANHVLNDIVADRISLILQYDVVARDFERAGTASSELKATLKSLGIGREIVRRIAIASYEAEMNAVIYSDGGTVTAEVMNDQAKIEVIDHGAGIPDIERAMQLGYSTAPEWIRELGFGAGMGLNNIKRCADVMDLQSEVGKGTHLTSIFYFKKQRNDEPTRNH